MLIPLCGFNFRLFNGSRRVTCHLCVSLGDVSLQVFSHALLSGRWETPVYSGQSFSERCSAETFFQLVAGPSFV